MACDVANSVLDVWFRLGFLSQSDLAAAVWVTQADLYQSIDDAVSDLVVRTGIFKVFDSSVAIAASAGTLTMPAGHTFTVFAYISYSPSSAQILRLTNVEQLFAFDANWTSKAGSPTRLSFDAGGLNMGGLGIATLYPSATLAGTLCQVMQADPATVVQGASVLAIPPVLIDYFTYAAIGAALSKESDHAKPEVAAHAQERMKLYEKVITQYWGPGL